MLTGPSLNKGRAATGTSATTSPRCPASSSRLLGRAHPAYPVELYDSAETAPIE
jgi:hypothetical protein